jgi:hypothetical protein
MFQKESEVRQEDFRSLILLAQSLRILGKGNADDTIRKGVSKVRRQLELNPEDTRVLSLVSGSLYEIGEKQEAFEWIHRAFEFIS